MNQIRIDDPTTPIGRMWMKNRERSIQEWPPDLAGDNLSKAFEIIRERFSIPSESGSEEIRIIPPKTPSDGTSETDVIEVDGSREQYATLLAERGPLSEEMLSRIERIMPVFEVVHRAEFIGGGASFRDEWIEGFNRDLFPEKEIKLWEWIAETLVAFSRSEVLTFEQYREAYRLLVRSTMTGKSAVMESADPRIFTADQVEYLLSGT